MRFGYDENEILKGVSFKANSDEIIGIVGTSGGGKTTIINLLMRFYDANNGQILINQSEISDFELQSLRQNIGIVTQRIYILNNKIAANVAYVAKEIEQNRVINALKVANACDFL